MFTKDLEVYKLSLDLVVEIYTATQKFPKSETFGMTSQLRRAAVSVPSNLAEGGGRTSAKELLYFISVARGSNAELETLIVVAGRVGLIADIRDLKSRSDSIGKMLSGLSKSVRAHRDSESG